MTTLADVTQKMNDLNTDNAPGSETLEWCVFCETAQDEYGVLPYDEDNNGIDVSDDFANYWAAIADEDYKGAAQFGDVGWIVV